MNGSVGRIGDLGTFCIDPSMDWVAAVAVLAAVVAVRATVV
jgi:hypothetical protein